MQRYTQIPNEALRRTVTGRGRYVHMNPSDLQYLACVVNFTTQHSMLKEHKMFRSILTAAALGAALLGSAGAAQAESTPAVAFEQGTHIVGKDIAPGTNLTALAATHTRLSRPQPDYRICR